VRALFASAGVEDSEVVAEAGAHPLSSPEDWWLIVLGSGYRGTVERLDAGERVRVRRENLDLIRRADVRSVEANVVYAVAARAQAGSA
jgi:hypothetical protein